MQGLEATFDDLSFEGGDSPQRVLPKIVPFGAALALAGAVSVWALHWQGSTLPDAVFALWTPAPTATHAISRPFADIAIDANLLAQLKSAVPAPPLSRLRASSPPRPSPFPLPRLEAFPPSVAGDPAGRKPAAAPGARFARDRRDGKLPLAARSSARVRRSDAIHDARAPCVTARCGRRSSRRPARQSQRHRKTLRMGAPILAGRGLHHHGAHRRHPAGRRGERRASRRWRPWQRPVVQLPVALWKFGPAPVSGYDHYTAVYDISARVVYLPDGTRLEAHSGLGQALDNPRFVAERAVGPTPPHLYELTLREGSFHGVQALRLNPVGEGGIYGRAGLLAHPFMLGPNGDSNGCVSFRDYDAFLRAYQNGQVKKIAVVAKL